MLRTPPKSTLTYTLFPYAMLFRAVGGRISGVGVHRVRSVELHRGREADVEDAQPGDLHRAHLLSMDYILICAKCDPCKRANVRSGCRPRSIGSNCGSPPRGRRLPSRLAWPMAAPSIGRALGRERVCQDVLFSV